MRSETTYLTASDGKHLFVRSWSPETAPAFTGAAGTAGAPLRAVIQLVHGMCEHSGRYARFAQAAVASGMAVVAADQRGHGGTISAPSEQGHTADVQGWQQVKTDVSTVRRAIAAAWPGVPVLLMGHSWGSMVVRGWAAQQAAGLSPSVPHADSAQATNAAPVFPLHGLILLGTVGNPGWLGKIGVALARMQVHLHGARCPAFLLENLAFSANNRVFSPARTKYDWISSEVREVTHYIADPYCGFTCTAGFYRDLLQASLEINSRSAFAALPSDLPVLIASGQQDPLAGKDASGLKVVASCMRRAKVREVTLRLYPGARHELLHEFNRAQISADLLSWIAAHL